MQHLFEEGSKANLLWSFLVGNDEQIPPRENPVLELIVSPHYQLACFYAMWAEWMIQRIHLNNQTTITTS